MKYPNTRLQASELKIDVANGIVLRDGAAVRLRPKEFEVLEYISSRAGTLLSRDDIQHHVWGVAHRQSVNHLAPIISSLRRKIERDVLNPKHIITIAKRGIRFDWSFEITGAGILPAPHSCWEIDNANP